MTPAQGRPWRAPFRATPLHARVTVPGSKSITNRALLLSALADVPSSLAGPLVADDTRLMGDALRALGCAVEWTDERVVVTPAPLHGPAEVDCGLAGTVMRFVPPVAALATGPVSFDGALRARERPLAQILGALRSLGADIDAAAQGLPFTVLGVGRVPGGVVTVDASASSQFVSALLLAAPRYDAGVDLRHDGKPLPSWPHIAMTVAMLRDRGVLVDDSEPNRWRVLPGPIQARSDHVEPDLSTAAPFLAAALVCGGEVTVADWPAATHQPGGQLREILEQFGARTDLTPEGLVVKGSGDIWAVDLDLHEVGELTPVLTALAALAEGTSYLRGIAHLRGHETDRLAALSAELRDIGGDVRETEDGLEIRPRPLHAGVFHAHDDHRLAQAAAVLGLALDGVEVDDITTTAKTFPGFADAWAAMLA